ncbi:MAG TPA: TonB-dependent receptor [Vicinamibacterales bacterium]|nr:TonB-dependent receptor [Vicinamibacterales bacterium]
MLRAVLAAAIVCAMASPVFAQTADVAGTVVDETNAAVPGATVTLSGAGPSSWTLTGARGDYAFHNVPNGTYRITVTLTGFATATQNDVAVAGRAVTVPAITLKVGSLSDTVVVSATRSNAALIDAPATLSVIPQSTLESTPATNYGDLMRAVPGVNVIQLSARDVNITSREATSTLSNSQLVLLDGRSIYLDFFGIVLWDFLPSNLSDIKQIEVIRGPASAVWGANALTGVVNVITKSPREAPGTSASIQFGGFSRDAGSTVGKGMGQVFGANASYAAAPNATWSYRVSAGYFNSDPFPRPVGQIPLIQDPRDPTQKVGGGFYPIDGPGTPGTAFENAGTSQPKFDARVDQEIENGRITYAAGVAGSSGIIHTGIGPFDIQKGSYMGYGKVNYSKGAFKLNAFTNFTSADAPNLLLVDPTTQQPLQLNFSTQTYDVEAGDTWRAGSKQVITAGGNVRQNNFNITIAPNAQNRTELGAYAQDEIFLDPVRLTIGGRVDKFGNLSDPVFSPRLAAVFKLAADHSVRVSFNRAFRSPSVINNYLDISIVNPTDLSALAPLLPPALRPAVAQPFPLVVHAVGSDIPINGQPQQELTEESLTAYEVAYTGTIGGATTVGAAFYVNDINNSINFVTLPNNLDPYTATNPPPGWPLPPSILAVLAQAGIALPRTAFTYLNLGPIREKGLELSIDRRVSRGVSAFANYSWQADPTILPDAHPYPAAELALPPTNRFNIGVNVDTPRYLGSASVNYADKAFWSDVLNAPYHGFTDAYTMLNGSFGVKWNGGHVTTLVKGTNLTNQDIMQHVFGDILKRSIIFEVRFAY